MVAAQEQYRFLPYYATAHERSKGILTCGFGRVVLDGSKYCPIGNELGWLYLRVKDTADQVWALSGRRMNCNQLAAVTSLTYNIGIGAFTRSSLRTHLMNGDYDKASAEFPKWSKQNGTVLKGLLTRRLAEQELFNRPPLNCKEKT